MRNLCWLACFLLLFSTIANAATEVQKLTASDASGSDYFGQAVSADGIIAIVGSPNDDDPVYNSGSAFVFH